jgi:hypothetical protein
MCRRSNSAVHLGRHQFFINKFQSSFTCHIVISGIPILSKRRKASSSSTLSHTRCSRTADASLVQPRYSQASHTASARQAVQLRCGDAAVERSRAPPPGDHKGPHHVHTATLAPTEYVITACEGDNPREGLRDPSLRSG